MGLDIYGFSQGTVSGGKLGADGVMTAVGIWGGPIGAGVSVVYFGVDAFAVVYQYC
jgi:hypothetical protein